MIEITPTASGNKELISLNSEQSFGWLIGWLEAEGTFYCSTHKATATRKSYERPVVRGTSNDLDSVEKVLQIAGVGQIYGPYEYGERKNNHYQWGISGKQPAIDFMEKVRPFMGARRRAQIDRAIEKATA